jgi:hypothetical protein
MIGVWLRGIARYPTDAAGNFLMTDPPVGADQVSFFDGGRALSYTARKSCADQHDLKPAEWPTKTAVIPCDS